MWSPVQHPHMMSNGVGPLWDALSVVVSEWGERYNINFKSFKCKNVSNLSTVFRCCLYVRQPWRVPSDLSHRGTIVADRLTHVGCIELSRYGAATLPHSTSS